LDKQTHAELSPDGQWVFYWSSPDDEGRSPPTTTRLMRFATSGGTLGQVLEAQGVPGLAMFDCPTNPSSSCVLSRWDEGHLVFYALDPIRGQGQEVLRTKIEQTNLYDWSISPDGSRIAIVNRSQQGPQITILGLRNSTELNIPLPSDRNCYGPSWAADGGAFFVTTGYQIARVGFDGKYSALLDRGRNQWLESLTLSPDGH
jgi:eukaryotic-like serine/threonine-protein kinase